MVRAGSESFRERRILAVCATVPGLVAANCRYGTPEAPFSAEIPFSGGIRAENERKKAQNAARNPSGDPGIALDMAVRGVIFSDNDNYRTLEKPFRSESTPAVTSASDIYADDGPSMYCRTPE